jgi:uncharacterized damage-inducible protein DinB
MTTIRQQLAYADNTRKLLHSVLRDNLEAFTKPIETIGEYKSIRALVAHIAAAEERWIVSRLGGVAIPVRFEDRAPLEVEAVFHDWEGFRAKTHAYVNTLDKTGLYGLIPIKLPQLGIDSKMTVEQILFHLFNHQTFHLGQVSMALQQLGIDPPNFDYVLLHGEG